MNYFEFYGIPLSFNVNETELKKKYFELSKKFHPDFYIAHPDKKQEEVLQLSTLNTNAFKVLSDFDKRMKYVLELKNILFEGEKYNLPPEFLMEMMEINEEIMEINIDSDQEKLSTIKLQIEAMLTNLYSQVKALIDNYNDEHANEQQLNKIKEYFYKKKYLLRIKESLDSFAPLKKAED